MTGEQKQSIQQMRQQGSSFSQIAEALRISVNTIKSFCRRKNVIACNASNATGDNAIKENEGNKEECKQCGQHLNQKEKSKPKQFCCDKCRFDWWNKHRNLMKHTIVHRLECYNCNIVFESYDKSRKYCGHPCYIAARFGRNPAGAKGVRHDERAV